MSYLLTSEWAHQTELFWNELARPQESIALPRPWFLWYCSFRESCKYENAKTRHCTCAPIRTSKHLYASRWFTWMVDGFFLQDFLKPQYSFWIWHQQVVHSEINIWWWATANYFVPHNWCSIFSNQRNYSWLLWPELLPALPWLVWSLGPGRYCTGHSSKCV